MNEVDDPAVAKREAESEVGNEGVAVLSAQKKLSEKTQWLSLQNLTRRQKMRKEARLKLYNMLKQLGSLKMRRRLPNLFPDQHLLWRLVLKLKPMQSLRHVMKLVQRPVLRKAQRLVCDKHFLLTNKATFSFFHAEYFIFIFKFIFFFLTRSVCLDI